ncbi:MAG TPA: pyruvate ferredoxin oxidoreductase [Methanosarcinales archaeon]|nr:pyruvate ferredoxin oxidoreductase [Methanosarcinales archaeon]
MSGKLKSGRQVVEGSYAVAHAVAMCRPDVISAYPITPQTHIVEDLSQFVADGAIDCKYINVESEFSALSALVGASASGARTYSATTSQGLALMHEVVFNMAGMRLPAVMTIVNRSMSAPINIWNDHQDSMAERDSGWIQLYVEDVQELVDTTVQAYLIAEDPEVSLPVMVCMDGFILSHVFEPVDLLDQKAVDEFLPPFKPVNVLDPDDPKSFGMFVDPEYYMDFRYLIEQAMDRSRSKIQDAAKSFESAFGRHYGDLIDTYRTDDAEIILVAMGSLVGTLRDVVDDLRSKGVLVGLLKIRAFRPFPADEIAEVTSGAKVVCVLDKNISLGTGEGAACTEIKASLYNSDISVPVIGFVIGLGGRDIPVSTVQRIVSKAEDVIKHGIKVENEFVDLKHSLVS